MSNCKNYAFIDGQNLIKSVEKFTWKFSLKKFINYLKKDLKVTKIFYFVGYIPPRDQERYKRIRVLGCQLCFKKVISIKDRTGKFIIKGNVDGKLITHTLIKISTCNKVVIVAGDGDYYYLIKFLIKSNKLLYVLMPSKRKMSSLYRNTDILKYTKFISQNRNILEE
jgi:uncharacterized LabA/DUF88 family protein